MQFGKITGVGLIVLGILLCGLQFMQYVTPPKSPAAADPLMARPEHKTSALPGLIGAACLVVGIVVLVTARRRDEPDPEHAVK
jgi:hypothetical protein